MNSPSPVAKLADLQRIALKIFLTEESSLKAPDMVPVFHRWIQAQAVDGLLIDVADYSHLPSGPSVILVAHEGQYVLDRTGGRLGLQYTRTQPLNLSLPDRLIKIGRMLIAAGRLLEQDRTLTGPVEFLGNEIQCVANDRLLAPNIPDTAEAFKPALEAFLTTLNADGNWNFTQSSIASERFSVLAQTSKGATLADLDAKLASTNQA
ncbi:MAG: hypothetical protein CL484_01850 [Acidobacteria bacterium]|nr:hypothetical protein [Acidobacteriota bacterium]